MIRVLIVEDSATTRELIKAVLTSEPDIEVIGEATDGVEGVAMAAQLRPDVITMDVNMPRMDGCEATRLIMMSRPTPIVVLTTVTRQEMIHKGLDILLAGGPGDCGKAQHHHGARLPDRGRGVDRQGQGGIPVEPLRAYERVSSEPGEVYMGAKLLIVEDSATEALRTRLILEREGYQISLATDGKECLTKATAEQPDLIILDTIMPRMSGYEAWGETQE